jgi:hypothetical protein
MKNMSWIIINLISLILISVVGIVLDHGKAG